MAAPNNQDKPLTSNDTPTDASASRPQGKQDMFEDALRQEGVSGQLADLARSIYQQESGSGSNTRTSNAHATGGMQIIPSTFNSVADPGWDIHDSSQNARAGIRYLKDLYGKANGDTRLTAAGYYGGPGALAKARQGVAVSDPLNPRAPNTLQYADQVLNRLGTTAGTPATQSATQSVTQPAASSATQAQPSSGNPPPDGSQQRSQSAPSIAPPQSADGGAAYCQALLNVALASKIPPPTTSVAPTVTNVPPPPAKDRGISGVVTDTTKALGSGVNGLISGVGEIYGLVSGNTDNSITRFGKNGQAYWDAQQSDALKQMKRERDAKIAAADGELNKFGTAAWETISSPSLLLDTIANNAATFVPGAALGKAAQAYKLSRALAAATEAGEISAKVASTIAKAGNAAEGLEAAVKAGEISPALAKTISTQAGKYAVVGGKVGGAVQQAADVSYSRYEDDMKKTDAEMMENPDYVALKQQFGGTPEAGRQAQHALALKAARAAFLPAAGISYAANSIVPGAGAADRALLGVAQKNAQRGFLKVAARDIAGEATTEILEEGGGRLAANAMSRHFVDPNQSLTDGVGENAGMGAAGGFGFGLTGSAKHALTHSAQSLLQSRPTDPGIMASSPSPTAVTPGEMGGMGGMGNTANTANMGSLSRAATAGRQASTASAMPGVNAAANPVYSPSAPSAGNLQTTAQMGMQDASLTPSPSPTSTPAFAPESMSQNPAATPLVQNGQAAITAPSEQTISPASNNAGARHDATANTIASATGPASQTDASAGGVTQQSGQVQSGDARFAKVDAAMANNYTLRGRTLVSPNGRPIKLSAQELAHYRQALTTTPDTAANTETNTAANTAPKPALSPAPGNTPAKVSSDTAIKSVINTAASPEGNTASNESLSATNPPGQAANKNQQSRLSLHGLDISIAPSTQSSLAAKRQAGDASPASQQQQPRYLSGTIAANNVNNTQINTLVGPHHASNKVFIADQMHPDSGHFSQHKVMLGFNTAGQARLALQAQERRGAAGRTGRNILTETTPAHVKNWLAQGNTSQPFTQAAKSLKPQHQQSTGQAANQTNENTAATPDPNSEPNSDPHMAEKATATPADALGRPLSRIMVNTHATDQHSGALTQVSMPASEALSHLDNKLDILKKLISCLRR